MTPVSAQGLAVLETLSQQPLDRLAIRCLVDLLRPAHGSLASTRASVSRTLHRLWRSGLVELENTEGHTLTERLAALDAELAEHEANPEAEYEEALEAVSRGVPVFLARGSADGLLENHRREVAREKRHLRRTAAVLTPQGQELLTVDVKAVNNTEGIVNRTHVRHTQRRAEHPTKLG